MQCYECQKNEASVKIGNSKGSIWSALLGKRCWAKMEIYLCRPCFDKNHVDIKKEYFEGK